LAYEIVKRGNGDTSSRSFICATADRSGQAVNAAPEYLMGETHRRGRPSILRAFHSIPMKLIAA
jgi:hypothetical protein